MLYVTHGMHLTFSPSAMLPKMLAAMCCSSAQGHTLVLQAMDAVKLHRRDKQRFKVSSHVLAGPLAFCILD